ncbi:MAG: hypothetical protein KAV82_07230 [Phycisphaerae bacterium]|nr:hypothetical protein [Phycisphaerae bacterium]
MSPQAQPHRLARTLLQIVSTVGVVGVVFVIYTYYVRSPEEQPGPAAQTDAPLPVPKPTPATQPAGPSVLDIEGVPLHASGRVRLNLYGSRGTQARFELEADSLKPSGRSEREFRLEKPTIRFRTPAGQLVNVTGDQAVVEMTKQRGNNYELARGRLEGHVVVLMDRLSDAQRAQLPPDQRDELTDQRKISIELEDLIFDLEYTRVESSGHIRAWSAEGEFEGRELLLRYDEAASRIEYLKITEGKRIALRGLGGTLAITLPGAAEPSASEAEETEPAVGKAEHKDEEPLEDDGVPLFVAQAPEKRRVHQTVTYHVSFDGEVAVDQFDGQTQTGMLNADHLAFLFDFGQEQRDLARRLPTSQPSGDESPVSSITPTLDGEEETEVVLNWKGPLVVDLVRDQQDAPAETFGKRLQITASARDGREVYIADRQGSARCRKLVYHYETEQVWLYGDAESGFTLDIGAGGYLNGRELAFDPQGQTAWVLGPGVLSDQQAEGIVRTSAWGSPQQGRKVSVTFADEMKLCLATVEHETVNPITGELVIRHREYLQSAELSGQVVMAQDDDSIAGDRIQLDFRPPSEPGSLADTLESLRAQGRVRMVQGDEEITCRSINITMGHAPSGRIVPERAEAVGDVVARQRGRYISATQRMVVDLQSVPVEKPPFDLVQAKLAAVRRGLDVDTIDWDAQREKYERKKKFMLGLRRIQAMGVVKAEDPQQNMRIDAGGLDCTFSQGRQIEQGIVSGRESLPANIEFGDFGIMGKQVEFNAATQRADVLEAGRLTFASRKDLDGRMLEEPVPISVTWTDSMRFRGVENTAVFTGAVHAVTENSTFDCGELTLDFVDEKPVVPAEPAAVDPWDWWILRAFRDRVGEDERLRLEVPEMRKQLAYLSATGGVTGLTAAYDQETGSLKTRTRIAGPRLAIDLRDQTRIMTIDDAGTLLIEDYRLKPPDESTRVTKMSPFGAEGENLPSQTFISWNGSMSFYGGNRLAVFEDQVELVYRSGSKLLLAGGVLTDTALAHLRESAGGRDARLLCGQLSVQFLKPGDRKSSASGGGIGGVSGNEVAGFAASSGVYFEDSGVSVICRTVTFDRERNLLQLLGTRQQPAELIDQRNGQYRSITNPVIYWERDTNRIEAPHSTIRIR